MLNRVWVKDVLLAFKCTPWRKVICRNQRQQEESLVGTACDSKCVSAEQRRQDMSIGEIVVGGKCCRGKSGNPRIWESVQCDAVLRCDVICCTFFRFVILSKGEGSLAGSRSQQRFFERPAKKTKPWFAIFAKSYYLYGQ